MAGVPRRTGIANLPLHHGNQSIELLSKAIRKTKLGLREKEAAMGRLTILLRENTR